jgi:DNA repair exonuclease SbcCD ATPase subunit
VKKVVFKSIFIKNFLSIGEKSLSLDFSKGINLITGENLDNGTRNGVGKSSLIEAIYWCLFGNTIRDIKNDKIIHNKTKKDCEVSLILNVTNSDKSVTCYNIKRFLAPSKIQIYCEDKDITLSTIPNNDDYIKNLLGASEELFNNAVIMTANNTLPFMAQKKIDKRKFLEGVFNLNVFNDMLLKTRSDYNEIKKENDIKCNDFVNQQRNLEIFEKQSKIYQEQKQNKIKNFNSFIDKIKNDIKELEKQDINISDILKQIKKTQEKLLQANTLLNEKEEEIVKLNNQHTEIKVNLEQLQKEKNNLLKKQEICPVCNRAYSDSEIEIVKDKILKIEEKFKKLSENKLKIYSNLQKQSNKKIEIKNIISQINLKIKELEQLKNVTEAKDEKIKELNIKIKEYKKIISDLKEEKDPSEDEIRKINQNIKEIDDALKSIKMQLSILESVKFVLSEEGVKTFIIKKMLNVLNEKLNYYLKNLDAPCTCIFNEQFEETIKNLEGKECSYFNFSGGERKRIDISILFMFQDILRFYSGTFFSLSMYDELFDSAIDESGIQKIIEILKNRVDLNEESIYIVSHNKSSIKNNFDNVVFLQKNKNQTEMIS